ncbi:MAG: hypothetical protein IJY61_03020 [Candidatus Gastranaerophilales bacterium]|nr:hypothetical protein [Candidatus Gastranaerophilales bacterium]
MADEKKLGLYKNILGDTKATIDAIQRFIDESSSRNIEHDIETEDTPAESINRVLRAAACEDTQKDIADFLKKI